MRSMHMKYSQLQSLLDSFSNKFFNPLIVLCLFSFVWMLISTTLTPILFVRVPLHDGFNMFIQTYVVELEGLNMSLKNISYYLLKPQHHILLSHQNLVIQFINSQYSNGVHIKNILLVEFDVLPCVKLRRLGQHYWLVIVESPRFPLHFLPWIGLGVKVMHFDAMHSIWPYSGLLFHALLIWFTHHIHSSNKRNGHSWLHYSFVNFLRPTIDTQIHTRNVSKFLFWAHKLYLTFEGDNKIYEFSSQVFSSDMLFAW